MNQNNRDNNHDSSITASAPNTSSAPSAMAQPNASSGPTMPAPNTPSAPSAMIQPNASSELTMPASNTPSAPSVVTATNDTPAPEHKRRVRYKGTHPRSFHEKYKEANPEKYADTIEKVISKGSTPAGMHISIMVEEILEALDIQPGQKGLDATLGYGGHTKAMLQKLEGQGHIYSLDVDPI